MNKQPKAYKAPHAVYVDGELHPANTAFVTAEPKGEKWEEVKPKEKAAMDAAEPGVPSDPSLEDLGLEALRAVAVTKKVETKGLDKAGLISAIKAANEPAL